MNGNPRYNLLARICKLKLDHTSVTVIFGNRFSFGFNPNL